MFENILHDIGGIYVYGIISICLFFTFFVGMLLWAFRLKKPYLGSMRDLPLDGGEVGRVTPCAPPTENQIVERRARSDAPYQSQS